ncbi:MAG: DNA polymerase III subunit delta, partial [Desulfosalsimonas sp.]
MAEIHYTDITGHVRSCRKNGFAQIYLIYGDPYLQQQAGEAVVAELLPDPDLRSVYLETVDAEDSSGASDAVERAGTYSFFSGPKVVVFKAGDLAKKGADQAEILKSAIRRGFPKNHYLIVRTDNVDKRTGLYKAIKNSGTVVDCSVPSGTRKAERESQRRILQSLAKQSMAGYDKSLDNEAFAKIYDLIGPEPGSFVAALGKLALFAE